MKTFLETRMRSRFAVVVLAIASLGVAVAQRADAQSCTAALDVDVHYCRDDTIGNPVPCDPLNLVDGMPVVLTVEVTNDSEFQPANPPADPPGGMLQIGDTIKVFYACGASVCDPGDELPGYFDFVSVAAVETGVSFADDGNGYSGTITIVSPGVLYASGDKASKDLVRVNLTARVPPGMGTVFARAGKPPLDTSDQILLLTDSGCLPGLTGGGQGSTAGQFDTVTDELDVCAHANKQTIKIDKSGSLEKSTSRVAFLFPAYDPSLCDLTFGYDNLVGGSISYPTIPAGAFKKAGRCYRTDKDKSAKVTGGVERAQLCPLKRDPDKWCLNIKGYQDFDAQLLDPVMPITIQTCGNSYAGPSDPPQFDPIWNPKPKVWVLPKAVWAD